MHSSSEPPNCSRLVLVLFGFVWQRLHSYYLIWLVTELVLMSFYYHNVSSKSFLHKITTIFHQTMIFRQGKEPRAYTIIKPYQPNLTLEVKTIESKGLVSSACSSLHCWSIHTTMFLAFTVERIAVIYSIILSSELRWMPKRKFWSLSSPLKASMRKIINYRINMGLVLRTNHLGWWDHLKMTRVRVWRDSGVSIWFNR